MWKTGWIRKRRVHVHDNNNIVDTGQDGNLKEDSLERDAGKLQGCVFSKVKA